MISSENSHHICFQLKSVRKLERIHSRRFVCGEEKSFFLAFVSSKAAPIWVGDWAFEDTNKLSVIAGVSHQRFFILRFAAASFFFSFFESMFGLKLSGFLTFEIDIKQ